MQRLRDAFEDFGRLILFAGETAAWTVRPPFRPDQILIQMAAIGVGSAFIVGVTGMFAGMVLALQMNVALGQFAAQGYVGGSVAFSLARELAPVFTALMVIGRSGSAIATELGTMRVTEQLDAMESMAVNPIQYLVVPRVLASLVMFPVLTMLFNALGYAGGFVMGVFVARIPIGPYLAHTQEFMDGEPIARLSQGLVDDLLLSLGRRASVLLCPPLPQGRAVLQPLFKNLFGLSQCFSQIRNRSIDGGLGWEVSRKRARVSGVG
jgi:phospholipid/cholesterol/gamma-HCH transport system permease protein